MTGAAPLGRARAMLGAGGPLAHAFEGYEDRPGQLAMADAVERALAEDRTLLCEAGTGTGKTLAYLVPAILSGRKVIVSTATKALEEQIFTKDLPLIHAHLGLEPEAAIGKGLGNYLCLRRYNELRTSIASVTEPALRRSLPLLEAWASDTESGDVAELVTLPEGDPLWREVASSSDTRIGASCAYFEECFVTRMKREMDRARLIVVNHHLFFADLAVKTAAAARGFAGAGALPPYDAVIFDEAHELEGIATDFFGVRLSRARVEAMLRDTDRALVAGGLAARMRGKGGRSSPALAFDPSAGGEGTALTGIVREAADRFFDGLATQVSGRAGGESRMTLGRDAWSGELLDAYHRLDSTLEALAGYAEVHGKDEAIKLAGQRAAQLRDDAAKIVDPSANQVTWVEVRARSVSVGASPIDLGRLFRERVFERVGAVVLTSATLTIGSASVRQHEPKSAARHEEASPASEDDVDRPRSTPTRSAFRFLRSRMGLDEAVTVPVEELSVPSPFDYPKAAILYTPRDLPEVNDAAFVARAAERVAELVAITGGGAFVLCTSVRSMRAFATALRGKTPLPPLLQGDAPKLMLLRRFRADRNAVLVATMSFWEGVDVPGDALRLVIIDKLPFSVPTDPVVAARCAALEEAGENPFLAYSVPEAAITLKQGFGRLIRSRSDRGIVAILDRRIRTRGYGSTLLASLPPARRTDRLDDVVAFWKIVREEALNASPRGGAG